MCKKKTRLLFIALKTVVSALAKDSEIEEDMAEMVASEIQSLSTEMKEIEEQLKVFFTREKKKILCFCDYSIFFCPFIKTHIDFFFLLSFSTSNW